MIGVGIIGTGSISTRHVQAYLALADRCRIVAVADLNETAALQAAEKINASAGGSGKVQAYADYRELLRRDDVQLVSVCTPPFVHAKIVIDALEAGKHALVEKPMAASLEEADSMIEAQGRTGKILSVVFQNRFREEWWRAKRLVESGRLGRIVFGEARCHWWRGRSYYDVWWRGTWEKECGGATINHAVHHLDGLLWICGEVDRVYAEMDAFTHDIEVEDLSVALIRFKNGAIGQVTSSVGIHANDDALRIGGEHGTISIPGGMAVMKEKQGASGFGERDLEGVSALERAAQAVSAPEGKSSHEAQIDDVLRAIERGTSVVVDHLEGRRSLEVITAIYKSATIGQPVHLPIAQGDPFYTKSGILGAVKRCGAGSSRAERL